MKSFIRITLMLVILAVMLLNTPLSWADEPTPVPPAAPIETQANKKIFLPFIFKFQFPLANGNFEGGKTGWAVSSTHNLNIITQSFAPNNVPIHGGGWGAWLGGQNSETTTLQQQVTIPANAPYLTYWHWIGSGDICGYDKAAILINGAIVHQYDLCSAQNTPGWRKKVANLSAYAGHTVILQLRVKNDSSVNSNLFLDDVTFQGAASLTGDETAATEAPPAGVETGENLYSWPKP